MNNTEIVAYIGLGSNLGDRKKNLDDALKLLAAAKGVTVLTVSTYLNTAPVGYTEQPDFLNAVAALRTTLSANDLLDICAAIESALKRKRSIHWGPRTIDLDILLYGDSIIFNDRLTVPHPRMHEREFVLKPLCEIAPDAIYPVFGKPVRQLLLELNSQ